MFFDPITGYKVSKKPRTKWRAMGLDNLGQGKWMKAVYSITIFLLMPLKADDFVYM